MVNESLTYDADGRVTPDPEDERLAVFKEGWRKAVRGEEYGETAHEKLSWHNLGWRMGTLFGETSTELKDELYMWCVRQQKETIDG